jgi:hypothetical protein
VQTDVERHERLDSLVFWRWWISLSDHRVRLHTHLISFFTGVEGWRYESGSCGIFNTHDVKTMQPAFSTFSSYSSSLQPFLREKTDRIYTLVTITAFCIRRSANFAHCPDLFLEWDISQHALPFCTYIEPLQMGEGLDICSFAHIGACLVSGSNWCWVGQLRARRRYLFI